MILFTVIPLFFHITSIRVVSSFQPRSKFKIGFGGHICANYVSLSRDRCAFKRAGNLADDQSSENDSSNTWADTKDGRISGKEIAVAELKDMKKIITKLGTKLSSPVEDLRNSKASKNGISEPPSTDTLGSRLDTLTSEVPSGPITSYKNDILFFQRDATSSDESAVTPSSNYMSKGASKPTDSGCRVSTTSSYLDILPPTSPSRNTLVGGKLNAPVTEQVFNKDIHLSSSEHFSSSSTRKGNNSEAEKLSSTSTHLSSNTPRDPFTSQIDPKLKDFVSV